MNNSDFERIVKIASKDTKKGSEIIARIFYRILRKNNFSHEQIIEIATNIISCLTKSLKNYENKINTESSHRQKNKVKICSKFSRNSIINSNSERFF